MLRTPAFGLLVVVGMMVTAARAFPEGYVRDDGAAVRFQGSVNRFGQVVLPTIFPEPGQAIVAEGTFVQCRPTAPVGTPPSSQFGPSIPVPGDTTLAGPERLIHPGPGVATTTTRWLLGIRSNINVEGFSHGVSSFNCQSGEVERHGLRLPTTIADRTVLLESDDTIAGVRVPALLLDADDRIVARVQDRSAHPDFPFAAPFNHLVRWPVLDDASAPEVLVSSRDLIDTLLSPRERERFAGTIGASLRITNQLPLADGSLWFVVDLNNSRGSRDVVPRSFLFRRDVDGTLTRVADAVSPAQGTGSGPALRRMKTLLQPDPERPLLVVGDFAVVKPEAPYRVAPVAMGSFASLVPGDAGVFVPSSSGDFAPIHLDPAIADLDGDLLTAAAEELLGTLDVAFDTDGDGFHDRFESLSPTHDPLDPADGARTAPPTRWGFSTRLHGAWFATPDTAGWNTAPYFKGSDDVGRPAPTRPDGQPFARYTPSGAPSAIEEGHALNESLGVDAGGFIDGAGRTPFFSLAVPDAPPRFAVDLDNAIGDVDDIVWLGPDDVHGAAFVHIPREGRHPIFRLFPDGRLEFLFDASWYDAAPLTFMMALPEYDAVLGTVGGPFGSTEQRRLHIFDEAFVPRSMKLTLSPSHSRLERLFGIGYGVADQLDAFAGGYTANWIAELVAVDDRLRPGDIVVAPEGTGNGLTVVREDLTVHRWLEPIDFLQLATGPAQALLEGRYRPLLEQERPPPLDLFAVDAIAVAVDASSLCLVGEGRIWELALVDGRATALTLPVEAGAIGCHYDDQGLVVLRETGTALRVERLDGRLVAEGPVSPGAIPWRLERLGPAGLPTWVVLLVSDTSVAGTELIGGSRCLDGASPIVEGVATVVPSPFSPDAAIWMTDIPDASSETLSCRADVECGDGSLCLAGACTRIVGDHIVAGTVARFCAGPRTEEERRNGVHAELLDHHPTLNKPFWDEIVRSEVGPRTVATVDLAIRPDGGVLLAPRVIAGDGGLLSNPFLSTPYFRGAFHPVRDGGVADHGFHRRPSAGPRFGVPVAAGLGAGPMAVVGGIVGPGWGEVADLSAINQPPPPPGPPPAPPPAPPAPPVPEPPAADDVDESCAGCGAGGTPSTILALGGLLALRRRRRRPTGAGTRRACV